MLPGGLHAAQFLQKYFGKYLRNASDNLTNTNTMRRNAVYSGLRKDAILEKVTAQPTAAGIGLPIYMKASNSPSIDQPNTATAPVLLFLKLHFCIKVIGRLQTLLQKKVPQLRCRCRCVVFSASVKVLPECHLHGRMYDYVCQQEADKIS